MSQSQKELQDALQWIIARIEQESDRQIEGLRPNWKKAAHDVVEEAYAVISVVAEWDTLGASDE